LRIATPESSPTLLARPDSSDQVDRRSGQRFPILLNVRYRVLRRGGGGLAGAGTTANISRAGFFVECDHQGKMQDGTKVEATMEWPVLLDGKTALSLVATGRVVRGAQYGFAVFFQRHEFRTAKRTPDSLRLVLSRVATAMVR
jgi:hypothetical protein